VAARHLPVLIVGDVHGDLERLFRALKPYPADEWRTIFLGDLVDYGMFGVGALRYARDRANSVVLLGNHEVAMLWALRDPQRIGFWLSIGGQAHDLEELRQDDALQAWLHARPAMLKLEDGTLVQHCGHDGYAKWLEPDETDAVATVNRRVHELLIDEREGELWDVLSAKNVFEQQPVRLERWLQATNSRRVLFGHTPHRGDRPQTYHGGRAINFDGTLSRSHRKHARASPVSASVAPLDALS
jgi:calcineurin-like phosphoesterase family protein